MLRAPRVWKRLLPAALLPLLAGAPLLNGQDKPVFSPPDSRPTESRKTQEEPAGAPESRPRAGSVDRLFEKLRQWPERPARQAALLLSGLGDATHDRLIRGLADQDWRVRAGCAYALGEMGDPQAVEPLVAAIRDPSNRAGLTELMRALVRIDPRRGTREVLPFLSHASSRLRRKAMQVLPPTIDPAFSPDLVALARHRSGSVRRRALELLARVPGSGASETFFKGLGDPEPRVAAFAARYLGEQGTPEVRSRLRSLAREGPLRKATHAVLALVHDEDLTGDPLISDQGPLRDRIQELVTHRDPFYQGAAAVALANLSYRSSDPALRELADRYLVPVLLGAVAGGVFYTDYITLEPYCFEKLELITGLSFGRDTERWKAWWVRNGEGFTARRELHTLAEEDLDSCVVRLHRRELDGRETVLVCTGDRSRLGEQGRHAPLVLDRERLLALREEMLSCGLFASRGERRDPERDAAFVRIDVQVGASVFSRFHHGLGPPGLQPLIRHLEGLARDLAWQRFLVSAGDREDPERLKRTWRTFTGDAGSEARRLRLLDLALGAYPRLGRKGRRLAVQVFRKEGDPAWVRDHADALAGLLEAESRLTREAAAIVELLAPQSDPRLRDRVLEAVAAAAPVRAEEILNGYMAQQPFNVLVRLMNDHRAPVRAAAAASLPRFEEQREVVDILIAGLDDYEESVREACISSLASMEDARVLGMLRTVLEGEDQGLRVRAIDALARVGGEEAVPELLDVYHKGGEAEKWAVVRALRKAGGRRAVDALAAMVRESGPIELRKEALAALRSLGGSDVGALLADLLERCREPTLRPLVVTALAEVMGRRAVPELLPALEDEDPAVARSAALALGGLGARQALPHLMELVRELEGDLAAERALERLTFHQASGDTPPERARDFDAWLERCGELSREEWLLVAAGEAGVRLDDRLQWLDPPSLTGLQAAAFIRLLRSGSRPLVAHADRVLLRVSGLALKPLPPDPVAEQVETRAEVYEGWVRRSLEEP